jgi:hypothetical protein
MDMIPEEAELKKMLEDIKERERKLKVRESELQRRSNLFEMQWKLLESELVKLAGEKEKFKREKAFFSEVNKHNQKEEKVEINLSGKMFFLGVHDELSLKKRYRDLLKLFHPDSMNGDIHAMQAINKEYEEIKRAYDI